MIFQSHFESANANIFVFLSHTQGAQWCNHWCTLRPSRSKAPPLSLCPWSSTSAHALMATMILPAALWEKHFTELEVLNISGECMLILNVADSMLGRELWNLILDEVPTKPGLQLVVSHTARLALNESLKQQGLGGQRAQCVGYLHPGQFAGCPSFCPRRQRGGWKILLEWDYGSDRSWWSHISLAATICLKAFAPWHLRLVSIKDFNRCDCHQTYELWILEHISIRAWTTWHGQQAFKVWLLVGASIRVWTTWHGQEACRAWLLEQISIRAWTTWHGQQAFKT